MCTSWLHQIGCFLDHNVVFWVPCEPISISNDDVGNDILQMHTTMQNCHPQFYQGRFCMRPSCPNLHHPGIYSSPHSTHLWTQLHLSSTHWHDHSIYHLTHTPQFPQIATRLPLFFHWHWHHNYFHTQITHHCAYFTRCFFNPFGLCRSHLQLCKCGRLNHGNICDLNSLLQILHNDNTIGNTILDQNMILLPFAINLFGRFGTSLQLTNHSPPFPPIPNKVDMYSKIMQFPCPKAILKTTEHNRCTGSTWQFYSHSYSAPTPNITTFNNSDSHH